MWNKQSFYGITIQNQVCTINLFLFSSSQSPPLTDLWESSPLPSTFRALLILWSLLILWPLIFICTMHATSGTRVGIQLATSNAVPLFVAPSGEKLLWWSTFTPPCVVFYFYVYALNVAGFSHWKVLGDWKEPFFMARTMILLWQAVYHCLGPHYCDEMGWTSHQHPPPPGR